MLEKVGYKDTEHEVNSNNIHNNNTLNELSNKAIMKNTTKLYSDTSNQLTLSMYGQVKPKLGTCYVRNRSQNKVILIYNLFFKHNIHLCMKIIKTCVNKYVCTLEHSRRTFIQW